MFVPLLLLGFVVPMIMPGADGKPLMSYQDWLPDKNSVDALQRKAKQGAQALYSVLESGAQAVETQSPALSSTLEILNGSELSSQKVYKWQDEFGQWHFTDDPAVALQRGANSSEVEQQILSYSENTMPAPPRAQSSDVPMAAPVEPFEPSLKNIPRVLDEAHRVKDLLEQRYRDAEQL